MKRREFIRLLGGAAAAWPINVRAQQPARVRRIGYLAPGSASAALLARDQAFQQGLLELGYVEGTNIVIEYRYAEGRFERLPELAGELGAGLVASLARPGGNVTGTSGMTTEVVGKTLELLKEVVPKLSRVAVLWNPGNTVFQAQMLKGTEAAADRLGVQVQVFGVQGPDQIDRAFAAITKENVQALLVLADPILALQSKRIVGFAEKSRLPAIYGIKEFAVDGGLMAYASDSTSQFRRAAVYVDRILKGAKPADLPVEQATKFELVINLKTAKALDITIPQSILLRADEVIE
jgi:putative ABC transport system substrate-binding protein